MSMYDNSYHYYINKWVYIMFKNSPTTINLKLSQLSLIIFAVLAQSAIAEETKLHQLEQIVVTAAGTTQTQKDASASISVVNQQQLKTKPISRLEDALQNIPGVNMTGSNANSRDIAIRGLPADYTLIMVDGKRQNTRESRPNGSGGFETGFIPPIGAIERIEVIRGPMSSLYGSDAMGGVVNIITKDATENWNGSLSIGGTVHDDGESGDGYNGNFFLSGPLLKDKLGIQLYGGGDFHQEDAFVGGLNKNNHKNINTKLTFTPTESQKFILEAGRNTQKKSATAGKSLALQTCRGNSCTPNSNATTIAGRNHWAFSYHADWDFMRSELSLYQERAKRQIKYDTGYDNRQPEITNTVFDAKFMLPIQRHFFVFGGQYQHAKLEDDSVSSVTKITNPRTGATNSRPNFSLTTNKAIQKALFIEDEITVTNNFLVTLGSVDI